MHWARPCALRALTVVVVVVALTRAAAGSVDRSRTHWVGKRVTLRVSDEDVADASWEVFYEPRTGRPYYHNRECVSHARFACVRRGSQLCFAGSAQLRL